MVKNSLGPGRLFTMEISYSGRDRIEVKVMEFQDEIEKYLFQVKRANMKKYRSMYMHIMN
jgi:hypothetical protein